MSINRDKAVVLAEKLNVERELMEVETAIAEFESEFLHPPSLSPFSEKYSKLLNKHRELEDELGE